MLEAGLRRWATVPGVPMSAQTAGGKLAVTLLHLGLNKVGRWTSREVRDALKICVQMVSGTFLLNCSKADEQGRIDMDGAIDLLMDDRHWFDLFLPTLDQVPLEPFMN